MAKHCLDCASAHLSTKISVLSAEGSILLDLMSRPQESQQNLEHLKSIYVFLLNNVDSQLFLPLDGFVCNMCYTKIPWFKQPFHDMFISHTCRFGVDPHAFPIFFPMFHSFHNIPCWGSQHGPPWNSSCWVQRTPTPPALAMTPDPRENSWPETASLPPQGILAKYLII